MSEKTQAPFAYCADDPDEEGQTCEWEGPLTQLKARGAALCCPACGSSAVVEVGTPEGMTFERYDAECRGILPSLKVNP